MNGGGVLHFVEENHFNEVTRLSLSFQQANDQMIKSYLGERDMR